jgi:hypothetical protein
VVYTSVCVPQTVTHYVCITASPDTATCLHIRRPLRESLDAWPVLPTVISLIWDCLCSPILGMDNLVGTEGSLLSILQDILILINYCNYSGFRNCKERFGWHPANSAEVQHSHWLCILSVLHIPAALATSMRYVTAK